MKVGLLLSRRAALTLLTALALTVLSGGAAQAAKKAPKVKGSWSGVLLADGSIPLFFDLEITKQAKSGKLTGTASISGEDPVSIKGKIKTSGKLDASYDTTFNGTPVAVHVSVKADRAGESAEGTFRIVDEDGNVVLTGRIEMSKNSEEE